MKEMVGGCCVCSDERGWTENPLVYCDGQGCTVAVHQACYGIVSVPSGPWFCRKCESQDGSQARVRCDLCPSRDGALKRSDGSASGGSGWAHVVCALYIPEVRFGNVTTMEPIILSHIPPERYNRNCYICEQESRGSRATNGACMPCNKAGCRSQFHVTCAQALGLLCEEAGNYMDNVKYCGYCQHHYSKLKKAGNVKTIPPYKPVDGEEEKERGGKRKPAKPMGSKDDSKAVAPKPVAAKDEAKSVLVKPVAAKEEAKTVVVKPAMAKEEAKFVVVKPIVSKEEPKTVVVKPTPPRDDCKVSGIKEESKPSSAAAAAAPKEENKFTTCNFTEAVLTEGGSVFGGEPPAPAASAPPPPPAAAPKEAVAKEAAVKDATGKKEAAGGRRPAGLDKKRRSAAKTPPPAPPPAPPPGVVDTPLVPKTEPNLEANVAGPGPPIVVSVPLGAVAQMSTPPPTLFQQLRQSMAASATVHAAPGASTGSGSVEPAKRRRSVSSEKPIAVAAPSGRSKPRPPTANKRASRSNQSPPPVVKDSPPPSPPSPSSVSSRATTFNKGKKKQRTDLKFASAAHMLGNRLNPSSHMSQKLGESLSAEVEAANANCGDGGSSPLTGPQLHSRVIASVRQAASLAAGGGAASTAGNNAASSLAGPLGMAFGSASAAVPQSLDQLLERQWEQGSQFLMEQAQHFDIASLLSCLHQLRAENIRLEEHVNSLLQRRDHLLAVNARLAIPLTTTPSANAVNANVAPTPTQASDGRSSRAPYENGLDSVLYPTATAQTGNPSPRAAPRSNQSYPAGYQGGSPLPQQPHPKHS